MTKKITSFLTICLLLTFKIYSFNYGKETDKIVTEYLKFIKKNMGIYAAGVGGGRMDEINLIGLHLDCYQCLNVAEARDIYLSVIEGLLHRINQNTIIRPYLHNYPFNNENLHFLLSFHKKNGTRPAKEHVSLITSSNGNIYYSCFNHDENKLDYLYQEPYEKAREIYYQNKLSKVN